MLSLVLVIFNCFIVIIIVFLLHRVRKKSKKYNKFCFRYLKSPKFILLFIFMFSDVMMAVNYGLALNMFEREIAKYGDILVKDLWVFLVIRYLLKKASKPLKKGK